ncbi:glutaredoxin family protein [Rothia uropygialis]|uniref:glutaredoxin family protein n=1 Tax=Kocuria sp. 36 TaxID=1415402 RepID=UPI00101CA1CD|nr:glutaredoxin family protein [Kocuria sp. 36]
MSAEHDDAAQAAREISVELLTSPGCHLCEAAKSDLTEVTEPLGIEWTQINVEEHLDLLKQHAQDIPVVRVNGIPRDFWRVDKRRLDRILRGLIAGSDPEDI